MDRRKTGRMDTKYLKVTIEEWVRDYETHVAVIAPGARERIVKMSTSMMDKIPRGKKGGSRAGALSSRRSGLNGNNPLKESAPCRYVEELRV